MSTHLRSHKARVKVEAVSVKEEELWRDLPFNLLDLFIRNCMHFCRLCGTSSAGKLATATDVETILIDVASSRTTQV